jgi:hypothetical protein
MFAAGLIADKFLDNFDFIEPRRKRFRQRFLPYCLAFKQVNPRRFFDVFQRQNAFRRADVGDNFTGFHGPIRRFITMR